MSAFLSIRSWIGWGILAAGGLPGWIPAQAVPADSFEFNDFTVQGWTLKGAFDPEIEGLTFPSNFTFEWNDSFNYPQLPGLDPSGNGCGSLELYTPGDHGIENPGGNWWMMQFCSPDLSDSESWQSASGFSVRVAECMSGGLTTLYVNLFVKVHDLDLDRDRYFTTGVAVPLAYNSWGYYRFNWWAAPNFPIRYIVREVYVDIWGMLAYGFYLNGGVYLDDVIPRLPVYVDVNGGGPQEDGSSERPFDQIQEGINQAQDGDMVIVRDGTYTGQGNRDIDFLGKAITVRSRNDPNTCRIDCEGTLEETHRGFTFHSGETSKSVLEGFTILNGFAQNGGGISCLTNSNPSIFNCVVEDCQASLGGGLFCGQSSPAVSRCRIRRGEADCGGGIYVDGGSPVITSCAFNENQASHNGGAICCYSGNPVITNCTIQGNSALDPADSYGGGIYGRSGSITVTNSIVWGNTAGLAGSQIALADPANPSALTISYSDAEGGPGAVYIAAGCTLNWGVGNRDTDPRLIPPENYHLHSDSPCIDSGDPVPDYTDQMDIDGYSRIFNARVDIGADEFSPSICNVTKGTCHHTIQQAIDEAVNGDTIRIPDGIYTGPGNRDIHFSGKAITVCSENGPARCIIDCVASGGDHYHRGFCFNQNEEPNSILDGVTVTNGFCIIGGGIWCNYSSPTITRCILRGNTANDEGGGILCSSSSAVIRNCTITGNTAYNGGAITCEKGGQPAIRNCTISFNIASWGGGLFCNNSNPTVSNCILSQDIASENGTEIALKSRYSPSTLTVSYSYAAGGSEAAYVEPGCTLNWAQGNLAMDPLLTPDRHLSADSPCIDTGDPEWTVQSAGSADIDGDDRILNGRIDMGSDEFFDTDIDGLPDWWEELYFGDPVLAGRDQDPDTDGLSNLQEYQRYNSRPNQPPYYVDPVNGNDTYNGLSPVPAGSGIGPKKTLQAGINAAADGDTVLAAAGTYTGSGNRWLDFNGKLIVLMAPEGPEQTTIDCQNVYTRAFNFHLGETPAAAVEGFTLTRGRRDYGGAIVCLYAHPQIRNCIIADNDAVWLGGGLYSYLSTPMLSDCMIMDNSPEGVYMEFGGASIDGTVRLMSNHWVGNSIRLSGRGTLQIDPDCILNLDNSTIGCSLSGTGTVQVDYGSRLVIESDAVINLGHETDPEQNGLIQCNGLFIVRDSVHFINTRVHVTRARFEGDVAVSNSVITAEAGSPYGQFFVEDTVTIEDNEIRADGDRYMDLDPSVFAGLIANNRIYVTITEGVGSTRGGLFELRGDPNLADGTCPPDDFFCPLLNIPEFDMQSWTLEELTLVDGAKVNLTNRFDFGNGGSEEVLYVKKVTLGADAELNTAFNRVYYGQLIGDPDGIKNKPLLGFSLNNVACNNDNEFVSRIVHNNAMDPDPNPPDYSRVHVSRIAGSPPDPQGMIRLCSLRDEKPDSPTYNQVISPRAKALFAKASEEKILIRFEYLFETSDPSVQMVIYLTDVPQILEHSDPAFNLHYIEAARLLPPLPGQPGSEGSGRFGIFSKEIFREHLDFFRGTRIELELIGPAGSCVLIDNWDPQIWCSDLYCSDTDGDSGITELDFLTVLAECGGDAGLTDENNSRACLDGAFSRDGYVNMYDTMTWDWILNSDRPAHLCSLCLSANEPGCTGYSMGHSFPQAPPVYFESPHEGLLVAGKRGSILDAEKKNDMIAAITPSGQRVDTTQLSKRTNGKLVLSPDNQLYQVNLEEGLIRLADSNSIVPSAALSVLSEPRYEQPATVYVGLYHDGDLWYGRPISDAAFDSEGFVYVVPVIVDPTGKPPYPAAAKLQPTPGLVPPYTLLRLYDDPEASSAQDNRNLVGLRELEVDRQGHLYLLNTHKDNESNIVWKYDTHTGLLMDRINLDNDANIPAPIGLHVSDRTQTLYMASSRNAVEANSTWIYGLDTETWSPLRTILIHNMGHVTDMTEDPATGRLYVSGITMSGIPEYLEENANPFYTARLAEIPPDSDNPVTAIDISNPYGDPNDYLAFPISILFVGSSETDFCQGADLDGGGTVGLGDFAIMASQWMALPGVPSADLAPGPVPDNYVDILDLAVLVQYWLESDCSNPCHGADLDGGGTVDLRDFAIMASQWMALPGVPSADLAPNPTGDNYVDILDLVVLVRYWLETDCENP